MSTALLDELKQFHTDTNYLNKNLALKSYIDSIGESPAQRTPEWYKLRQTTIGGSEIATVIGKNPYETSLGLLQKKIIIKSIYADPMAWGTMMEPVTTRYSSMICNTKIFEAGSLSGLIPQQRYSPDGLGVVYMKDPKTGTYRFMTILFEFKAPFSKVPKGIIPDYYMPQVQTGMCSIPLTENTIFVNNLYSRISLNEIKNLAFNKDNFLCIGGLKFYVKTDILNTLVTKSEKDPEDVETLGLFQELTKKTLPIDFGSSSIKFKSFLWLYVHKVLRVEYSDILFGAKILKQDIFKSIIESNDIKDNIKQDSSQLINFIENNEEKNEEYIGFMCYKLEKGDTLVVEKDPTFEGQLRRYVPEFLETLNTLLAAKNPEASLAFYESLGYINTEL